MANAIYPKYKEAAMGGGANADLLTENVKAILVDLADYTYSAADEFLTSVLAAARVSTSANLTTKSVTDGTFDCDDYVWSAATGDISEAIIYYIDTGVEGTSRLVAFIDTSQTNLPITPNGGDINFTVDAGGVVTL